MVEVLVAGRDSYVVQDLQDSSDAEVRGVEPHELLAHISVLRKRKSYLVPAVSRVVDSQIGEVLILAFIDLDLLGLIREKPLHKVVVFYLFRRQLVEILLRDSHHSFFVLDKVQLFLHLNKGEGIRLQCI